MPESVLGYLPHQAPMIMIDDLVESGEDYAISRVRVTEKTNFLTEQGLPAWVGIELMAQTVSLFGGIRGRQQGLAPRIGFLLGTRQYHSSCDYFPLGCELLIKARQLFFDEKKFVGIFDCHIDCSAGQASAKLNVYQPDDLQKVLKE